MMVNMEKQSMTRFNARLPETQKEFFEHAAKLRRV